MLHRQTADGLVCITQPTHAWLAGQLARSWGNDQFGRFAPWEAVCLGAEQHDIGWHRWEGVPTFNPKTGYPHSFTELPTAASIDIWSHVKDVVTPLGRYPALLISLHGTGLFQRFTHWQASPESTQLVQQYLHNEEVYQQQLIQRLQADSYYAAYADPSTIARNRQLVVTWDTLSLMICMGVHEQRTVEQVPMNAGETTLTLAPIAADPTHLTVSPWPFWSDTVQLVCEGRILTHPVESEAAMQEALRQADWITITTTLQAGDSRE
jgi:hypothetical protein